MICVLANKLSQLFVQVLCLEILMDLRKNRVVLYSVKQSMVVDAERRDNILEKLARALLQLLFTTEEAIVQCQCTRT